MRALATIHNSLRPHGLLLDVRPAPQHPQLVIQHHQRNQRNQRNQHGDQNSPATAYQDRRGGEGAAEQVARVVRIGQIDDSYRIGTQVIADAAMQTVIDAGHFVRERAETFTVIYHSENMETLLAYMAEHWSSAHISAHVIAQAREELAREPGEAQVRRAIRAVRLRRT